MKHAVLFVLTLILIIPSVARAELVLPEPLPENMPIRDNKSCVQAGGAWSKNASGGHCIIKGKKEGLVKSSQPMGPELMTYDISGLTFYQWVLHGQVHGPMYAYNERGTRIFELTYLKGALDGVFRQYSSFGQLEELQNYRDGVLEGKYARFNTNTCMPLSYGQYTKGLRTGHWVNFTHSGSLLSEGEYKDDQEDGVWTYYDYMRGAKIESGPMLKGQRTGSWSTWTLEGSPWLNLMYKDGQIATEDAIACRKLGGEYEVQFDIRAAVCMDFEHPTPFFVKEYYPAGALWKYHTKEQGSDTFRTILYHPTQELLSEGVYASDLQTPEGLHIFKDRQGKEYGRSNIIRGTGDWTEYWYNGKVAEKGSFLRGDKTGLWTIYNEHGTKVEESNYREGVLDGEHLTWFENGVLSLKESYLKGHYNGTRTGYWMLGGPAWEAHYNNGELHGIGRDFYPQGNVKRSIDFSNVYNNDIKEYYNTGKLKAQGERDFGDTRDGHWIDYFYSGVKWREANYVMGHEDSEQAQACSQSGGKWAADAEKRQLGCGVCRVNEEDYRSPYHRKNGHWTWWHDNGVVEKSGTYREDKKEGDWIFNYATGNRMMEGAYLDDQPHGEWQSFFESGKLKFKGGYKEGVSDGMWKTFFASGGVSSEGRFVSGQREGVWKWYYEGGAVRETGGYLHNAETGIWTSYYDSGEKEGEGPYVEGKRDGAWTWWRKDGSVWRTAQYLKGKEQK